MNERAGEKAVSGKRILERTIPDGYVHIPSLRQKLKWLYQTRPLINRQYKLARALGVAPSTLSGWIYPTPDCIKIEYFNKFLDIWGLPREVLEIPDLNEFREALDRFRVAPNAWDSLLRDVADDDRIEITASRGELTKGLIDPDELEESGVLKFRGDESIIIRVPNEGFAHGLLLLQDRLGWYCLRPNALWKDTAIGEFLIFPRQENEQPPRYAPFDTVGGPHRVLAILLSENPPNDVVAKLSSRPIDVQCLSSVAALLHASRATHLTQFRLLSRQFLVLGG